MNRSRHPLFDILVELLESTTAPKNEFHGISVSEFPGCGPVVSKFDLRFAFAKTGEEVSVMIEYNTDLYTHHRIEQMANHLQNMLAAIVSAPDKPIGTLEYLGQEEKNELLNIFNDVPAATSTEHSILKLFEQQVIATPNAIAIQYHNKQLTYRELDERSNQLAHWLITTYAVGTENLAGILMERSEKMIIAILLLLPFQLNLY